MKSSDRAIDGVLVEQYQSGSVKAIPLLVRRWHKRFCEKAFYIVKDADEAKDIAQDCWRTIIDKLETLKDPKSFGGWAMRIVHTKSIDAIRNKQKEWKKKEQFKKEIGRLDEPYTERTKLKQELDKAIKQLPIEQQHVITLFYLNEYSLKEIAQLLNIKIGTVKSRLFHAREKLKTILKLITYENT